MNFSHRLPTGIFGAAMAGTTIVAVQCSLSVALAADVREIAREITVRIDGSSGGGSGFIVRKQDDTYTVVTNEHLFRRLGEFTVTTEDGRQYQVGYGQIQKLPRANLAVLSFTSSQDYRVVKLGDSDDVSLSQTVYVSGWLNPLSDDVGDRTYRCDRRQNYCRAATERSRLWFGLQHSW